MSIHIKHKLKMRSLDYTLWDWKTGYLPFMNKTHVPLTWLIRQSLLGCPLGQCPIKKWRPPHLCSKRQNGWQIRFPVPPPPSPSPALSPNFWFLRKRGSCLRFQENIRGSFHIKIMLEEQNNVVWTPNSKLLLSLLIRVRKE